MEKERVGNLVNDYNIPSQSTIKVKLPSHRTIFSQKNI